MSWMRAFGSTDMSVSALGLGTVKLGRSTGVKYPSQFTIPDDREAARLIDTARDLGINLIDTAPAYGNSEERLGSLLAQQRNQWVICSKVGEEFEDGESRFDFSPEHTHYSIERSLQRLKTEVIDIVLVHSQGNDLEIMNELGTLDALAQLKQQGLIRAYGMSTKTVAGGLSAATQCDAVMLTYNLEQREEAVVLDACQKSNTAAVIKKALASGHLADNLENPLQASMDLVFSHPGTSSAIVGTISTDHLHSNVAAAQQALKAV